jgi:hypothetical protein
MFTQEKKDIKERLNALSKDDRNEIIASLEIDPTSAANSSKRESKQLKGTSLTWEKFDRFLILVSGGIALGTTFAGFRGAAIGAVIAALYSWYILNDKAH